MRVPIVPHTSFELFDFRSLKQSGLIHKCELLFFLNLFIKTEKEKNKHNPTSDP